jgi:Icc-related predicted phosphoesterase
MPKIVFISDTHGFYKQLSLPEGDILVHSGDFGPRGTLSELKDFHRWMISQPHQYKVFIAGNHDWCFEREPSAARKVLEGSTYLQDEAATIMGLQFYGSPWQPRFYDWAFNLDRGAPLEKVWAKIPDTTDVLVTHGPPYGILDATSRGEKVGCEDLLERVQKVRPRLHLFGHIHEGYGVQEVGGTTFGNGAICDLRYVPRNLPLVFEVDGLEKG